MFRVQGLFRMQEVVRRKSVRERSTHVVRSGPAHEGGKHLRRILPRDIHAGLPQKWFRNQVCLGN